MSASFEKRTDRGGQRSLGRRTIVKGAAWSVPVIATATAAPAYATASGCTDPTPQTFNATTPSGTGLNDYAAATTTFNVPTGVTSLQFEVAGGAGGAEDPRPASSGGLVTGVLSVKPGDLLTLIVGQGGCRQDVFAAGGPAVPGGYGYGNGGGVPAHPGINGYGTQGGSGGGGSAILLGDTPLVVAGGGGGAAAWVGDGNGNWSANLTGKGGDGGSSTNGADETLYAKWTTNGTLVGGTGKNASGATPGAGGTNSTRNLSASYTDMFAGASGSGHNGADGVYQEIVAPFNDIDTYAASSGAGGGGYAGGGSGGLATFSGPSSRNTQAAAMAAGAGGGGSNYTAVGLVTSAQEDIAGNGVEGADGEIVRSPGWITLKFEVCLPVGA